MINNLKIKFLLWLISGLERDGIRSRIVLWAIQRKVGPMLDSVREKLAGKKTYIVGIGSIIALFVAWVNGTVPTPDLMEGAITALLGMTLRAGISGDTKA